MTRRATSTAQRWLAGFAIVVLTLWSASAGADTEALEEIQEAQRNLFADIAPSVVFLAHGEEGGTGFFISSSGDILTNAHVVEDETEIEVVLHNGDRHYGEVVEENPDYDLALVSIDAEDTPPVDIAPMDDVQVGDWVGSVGHGLGAIWTFTTGMITNIYPYEDERPVFQTQLPVNPGNSGGPVFNHDGEVIGLVTFGILQADNLNFAIPVEQAVRRLDTIAGRCDCLVVEAPAAAPVYVDDVMVGTGPRVVVMAEERDYEVTTVVDGQRVTEIVEWPEQRTVELGED